MSVSKDELVAEAEALGIADAASTNKDDLRAAVDRQREAHAALGPVVPEGQTEPEPPKSSGKTVTGVQPVEDSDIPEAGR